MSNQNNHEIQSLLAELDHRQHAGAADLRRAWAIDALLTNQLSVAEAAAAAGVSEVEFRGWLRQRNLSQATTAISIKEPPVAQPEAPDDRPKCENCQPVTKTRYECFHWNRPADGSPCD